jgi:hypothetical protein
MTQALLASGRRHFGAERLLVERAAGVLSSQPETPK